MEEQRTDCPDNLDDGRPEHDHDNRRENEQDQGEKYLGRDFRGLFFRTGLALVAQIVGKHPQRIADADAEPVGLGQHRRERRQFLDTGAQRQVAQRRLAGAAGAHLEVRQLELLGQGRTPRLHFLGHARQRRIHAQSRLDAHEQQVGGVGEALEDVALARTRRQRQRDVRQVAAGRRRGDDPQQQGHARRLVRHPQGQVRGHAGQRRQQRLQAEEHVRCLRMADPGMHELDAERRRRPVAGRRRQPGER
ncbi:conserved hypothetical protein, partial [Ricinus communis]